MKLSYRRILQNIEQLVSRRRRLTSARRLDGSRWTKRLFVEGLEDRRLLATLYVDNPGDYTITTDQGSPGLDNGDTVTWNPGPGSQHGGAVTGLTFGTNAFGTIQGAVNAATAGDTIRVGPGTFAEGVNVNKQLFVLGNQVGVDAQAGRAGASETIVTGAGNNGVTPFYVTASDVELNGFTIEGATNVNQFGFGIVLGAGTSGSEVRNNIVQNNIAGLSLANASTTNATIIERNLFQNNNAAGPVSGTGIYTDQFNAGGALNDVLIDFNTFNNNPNVAVNISSTNPTLPASNITISRNVMTNNGNAVILTNGLNSTITQNEIFSSTGSQVVLGGGDNNILLTQNCIELGASRGIRIFDDIGGIANQNVTINGNFIENNAGAGLEIESGAYLPATPDSLNAENNWWGSPSGPTNPRNPGGTGEEIVDPLNQVDFVPFLTSGADAQDNVRGCQLAGTASADLSVIKTDTPDPVTAGQNITYTITVTNNGPDAAQNVILTDRVPDNTTFVSFVSPPGWTGPTPAAGETGTITRSTPSLAAGATATFTMIVNVNASTPTGTVISNTARVSSATVDVTAANNTSVQTTTVGPVAVTTDVSVTKADSPDPVPQGSNLTYTIVVTNNGPNAAQNVTLTDVIPANTTFVSFTTPAGWTAGANPPVGGTGTVSATNPSLAAGSGPQTFTLVVRPSASAAAGSTISNTATVTTTTTDTNSANNTDTETTTVAAAADLSVTKTDNADPVAAGDTITYTITVANGGASDAQNVTLSDVIPANTTFVSAMQTSGPAFTLTTPPAGGTGTFTATTGTLAAGATATFTLVVQVDSTTAGGTTISNTATVTSTTSDTNLANNSDTETTTVEQVPVLACEVTTLNSPGNPGTATLEDDADNPGAGALIVTGTNRNDVIIVEPKPGNSSRIRVLRNGQQIAAFNRSDVQHIVVFGLGGNDKIIVNASLSQQATLFGDAGNDDLFAGRGADGLDGGDGNDRLFGGSGNDVLCGGNGNDFVYGQAGNDTVGGDAGNDHLYGEAGNDLVLGGGGNDFLFGGAGNDQLFGQAGNDQLFGDSGNDILVGGDGNDKLFGDGGRDLLIGGNGRDQLFGEDGDDILVAGPTVHDENVDALAAIMAEWSSSRAYSTRVNNIRFGGGANGGFTLDDATVIDDGLNDLLTGDGGLDWFLFGSNDRIRDRSRNELVN